MLSRQEQTTFSVYYPWRRYWARQMDFMFYSFVISIISVFIFKVNPLNSILTTGILGGLLGMVMTLFLEPLFLHYFATTPGKWIMGLRLTAPRGHKLTYMEGFIRTLGMIWYGMGFGIPIYSIYRLYRSYKDCNDGLFLPWDDNCCYVIEQKRSLRYLYFVMFSISAIVLEVLMVFQGSFLFNHGEQITKAELAENYRHITRYEGRAHSVELSDDLIWSVINPNAHQPFTKAERIKLSPLERDGHIQELLISYSTGPQDHIVSLGGFGIPLNDIVTAYVGSQEGYDYFDHTKNEFAEYLAKYWTQPFEVEVGDMVVNYQPDMLGYRMAGNDMILAEGDAFHFSLKVTIKKKS